MPSRLLLCCALVTVPAIAHAGALGDVLSGLGHATGQTTSTGKNGPSNTSNGSSSGGGWGGEGSGDGGQSWNCLYGVPPPSTDPVDVSAYLGVQSVVDSDGSFTGEVTATHKNFGLSLRGTMFFEKNADMSGYARLDLGTISGEWRVAHGRRFAIWLEGGGAMISTTTNITLFGAAAGATADYRVGGLLGVSGDASYGLLQDGVRYLELRAGLSLSILRLSYRIVDFNVGPPLRGPELGVALTF